ncbi:Cyclic pyranopterin monophosphate synthase [subsurface metagenome]
MNKISHVDFKGKLKMVDVSKKPITYRKAKAHGKIWLKKDTLELIKNFEIKKGDVLSTAKLAGIMAAKRTHELIPLCHPLSITNIEIKFVLEENDNNNSNNDNENENNNRIYNITCISEVKCDGKTGVEMEAMISVSITLLTIYDMCKAVDRDMEIGDIMLIEKSGGKSGYWKRERD